MPSNQQASTESAFKVRDLLAGQSRAAETKAWILMGTWGFLIKALVDLCLSEDADSNQLAVVVFIILAAASAGVGIILCLH